MGAVRVKTTSASGAKWRRYLAGKLKGLPIGGQFRRFLDGFLLAGKRTGTGSSGLVLDLPCYMLVTNNVYDGDPMINAPLVTVAPSRDLFNPDTGGGTNPDKEFTERRMEESPQIADEFLFTTTLPAPTTRYISANCNLGYTGSGAYRGGYTFNVEQPTLELWPFENPPRMWVRWETRFLQTKSLLRLGIEEGVLTADSGGYRFYAGATDTDRYPESVPMPSCDRRILVDGTDMFVGVVPVVSDTGVYDEDDNNRNYGFGAAYFFRAIVVSEGGVPVDAQVVDTWVVGTANVPGGALSAVPWTMTDYDREGVMPNRLEGDIALTETGDIFWGGVWETSREYDNSVGYVGVRSLATIDIPLGGNPVVNSHWTSVFINGADDEEYDYLSMDSDPTSDVVPYVHNAQAYAPTGLDPFFIAEAVWVERGSISMGSDTVTVAQNNSASIVVGRSTGVDFVPVPDGAFQPPGTTMGIRVTENATGAARHALVDANKTHPRIGFAIRMESSFATVKWMELDLADNSMTLRGIIGTAGVGWGVQPTVTCYQRAESAQQGVLHEETKPYGVLLTYGVDGEGFTKVSKDSGETWDDVAKYAARSAAYYFGSGFFGTALDQLYYEVNDDG